MFKHVLTELHKLLGRRKNLLLRDFTVFAFGLFVRVKYFFSCLRKLLDKMNIREHVLKKLKAIV